MTTVPQKDSETVSFRMSGALLARLTEEAAARGVSRGEHARNVLITALQDEHRLQVLEDIHTLRGELQRLRTDVASTLEVVLLNLAKVDQRDVTEFISKNLRR